MEVTILVGPTASGKSTVLTELCRLHDFEKLVTTTTREPREGEVNGVDYHFLTKEDFVEKEKDGYFLESVFFKNNHYGTGLNALQKDFGNKKPIIILEPVGAKVAVDIFKKMGIKPFTIYIDEPYETCVKRVMERAASEEEKVHRLNELKTTEKNWSTYMDYDLFTVPNSTIEENCIHIKKSIADFSKQEKKVRNKRNRRI